MTKKDFQLFRCLYVHNCLHMILSIGLTIYIVYDAFTVKNQPSNIQNSFFYFLYGFTNFLHYIPFCLSFYIFIWVSKAFRNEFKRILYQIFRKNQITIHDEDQQQGNQFQNQTELNVVSTIVLLS